MKITILGTGYVGLVTGTCFADFGHGVVCADIDEDKIARLHEGQVPFHEPGLPELVSENVRAGRLSFTTDLAHAVREAEVAFIAVGTPTTPDGRADLSHVLSAADAIGRANPRPAVVVTKSTVPVGTTERVRDAIRAQPGTPVAVAHNPEFLKEGTAVSDFQRPDRVVLGVEDDITGNLLSRLYAPFVRDPTQILVMDVRSAELTKYASNAMLAMRISFMNEMAHLCEHLGADIHSVRRGVGADARIGDQFLYAGLGWGGSCLLGEETVLVRCGGRTQLISLEKLYDDSIRAPDERRDVLSWEPGHAPRFCQIDVVTKRSYEGIVSTLTTKMGRRVTATADHPFIASRRVAPWPDRSLTQPEVRLTETLTTEDWLPIANGEIPCEESAIPSTVRVPDHLSCEDETVIVRLSALVAGELRKMSAARIREAVAPNASRYRANDIQQIGVARLDEVKRLGLSLCGASLATARNGTYVPAEITTDEAFWRIIGLYIAEGWCTVERTGWGERKRLSWSFHPTNEMELVDEVAAYWRGLGVKADVRHGKTSTYVTVSSRILADFFLRYIGVGSDSYDQRIPDMIWNAPREHKRAILTGMWLGDGYWQYVNEGPNVTLGYGTVSRELADGILRLLGDFGIIAAVRVGRTTKSTVDTFWIAISGADQIEKMIWLAKPAYQAEILASIERQERRIAPTGYIMSGETAWARIRDIESRHYAGDVFSLEVRDAHTFITTGGLAVHNCFGKDLKALLATSQEVRAGSLLCQATLLVNTGQRRRFAEKIARHFQGELHGRTIAVWGLSFKPNTDDMRDAPSIDIIEALLADGATVRACDPEALAVARTCLRRSPNLSLLEDPYEAARGADAVALVTEWRTFRQPDWLRLKEGMKTPVLFDGRNVWDEKAARAAGFTYYGVGRP